MSANEPFTIESDDPWAEEWPNKKENDIAPQDPLMDDTETLKPKNKKKRARAETDDGVKVGFVDTEKLPLKRGAIITLLLVIIAFCVTEFMVIPYLVKNPKMWIGISHFELMGQLNDTTINTVRDVGSSGKIDDTIIWVFGDTFAFNEHWQMKNLTCNTAATGDIHDVQHTTYHNMDNGVPQTFVPYSEAEHADMVRWNWNGSHRWGLWVSNVVQTGPGEGVVFFQKDLILGKDQKDIHSKGTGVARVTLDPELGPIAYRTPEEVFWGPDEPSFGCFTTVVYDDYVYAYGGTNYYNCYIARVHKSEALDKSKYEYWTGSSWTSKMPKYPLANKEASMFWALQAGSIIYSKRFKKWLVIYDTIWMDHSIQMKMSDSLTGPWGPETYFVAETPQKKVKTFNNYCMYAHPEYDASGRSLLVSWTDTFKGNIVLGKIHWA